MHFFAPAKNEYLQKYIAMAKRFELIGAVLILSAFLCSMIAGNSLRPVSLLLFFVGLVPLVIGGSSIRPHNMLKSFAQLCSNEPDTAIADALLEVMERNRKTALTKASMKSVYMAVETYAACDEVDPELLEKLRAALVLNLSKKSF